MEGKVVVLLRTSSVARAPMYHHLRYRLGLTLVVVHPCRPAEGFADVFHYWLQHDTCDIETLRPALRAFLEAHALVPDAIVSFDEYAVYQATVLAEEHGLQCVPLPPAEVQRTNVKASFRGFCQDVGIISPAAVVLPRLPERAPPNRDVGASTSADEHESHALSLSSSCAASIGEVEAHIVSCMAAAGLSFPLVLKPSPGAGSLLARRCDTLREAATHALTMWNAFDSSPDMMKHFTALTPADRGTHATRVTDAAEDPRSATGAMEILMEEFIGGHEVDIDCVVQHSKVKFFAISDNFDPVPPFFAEAGGLCPSAALNMDAQRALRDLLFQYVAVYREHSPKTLSEAHATVDEHIDDSNSNGHTDGDEGEEETGMASSTTAAAAAALRCPSSVPRGDHRPRAELNGVLHFEAKYDPARGRAYIVEVNCRPGSAETDTMVKAVFRGFELGEGLIRCALGLPVEEQLRRHYPECFPAMPPSSSSSRLNDAMAIGQRTASSPAALSAAVVATDKEAECSDEESVAGCEEAGEDGIGSSSPQLHQHRAAGAEATDDGVEDEQRGNRDCGHCTCSAFCECCCCRTADKNAIADLKASSSGGCDCRKPPTVSAELFAQVPSPDPAAVLPQTLYAPAEASATGRNALLGDGPSGCYSPQQRAYAAALGGVTCGAFSPCRYAASVNIYAEREGVLAHVAVPGTPQQTRRACLRGENCEDELLERSLIASSVSARVGDRVGPPPRPFCLLAWMVADGGDSATLALHRIRALTEQFEQIVVVPDGME